MKILTITKWISFITLIVVMSGASLPLVSFIGAALGDLAIGVVSLSWCVLPFALVTVIALDNTEQYLIKINK